MAKCYVTYCHVTFITLSYASRQQISHMMPINSCLPEVALFYTKLACKLAKSSEIYS